MRIFFGIEPSAETKAELTEAISKLHNYSWGPQIRWTRPENLHITLRFIGNCEHDKFPTLLQTIAATVNAIKSFTIQLEKICLFPSASHPHVLAMLTKPSAELFKLVENIEQAITYLDFPAEKRAYLAHLTLGRLPERKLVIDPIVFPNINASIFVDHITLFSSEQINNNRVYNPLNRISLK